MMMSNWFGTRDDDTTQHPRRSRRRRQADRSRSLRGVIASIAVGGLLVVGLPTMAFAEGSDPLLDPAASEAATESTEPAEPTEEPAPSEEAQPTEEAVDPTEEAVDPTDEAVDPTEEAVDPTEEAEPTEKAEQPAKKSAAKAAPAVEALVDPTTTTSVVRVQVGDDRSLANAGTINPLAGVTLALFTAETGGSQVADPWATCVSDATGVCEFVIPDTGTGGANRDRQLWVRQVGAPSGYFANTAIRTGDAFGGDNQQTPYAYRIGNASNSYQLRGNTVYSSTSQFMVGTGNTNRKASGGTWQVSRNNVALPQQCGLDVALVMDLSGSVNPNIAQARAAGQSLVTALGGTPSRVGLFTFAAGAPANNTNNQNRPITAVSTAAGVNTVNGWIGGLTAPTNGTTNWDRGLYQVATAAAQYDVAIILTDGNPTVYGTETSPGDFTRTREVENAIFSANAVKKEGTRVIALGVGSGITNTATALNLAAISGPTKFDGSNSAAADYYQESSYTAAADALRELALGNCQGGVSVVKQVIPTGGTIANAQPAAGWAIAATNPTNSITVGTPNPADGLTNNTGAINYPLDFPGGVTSGTVTIRETQQTGYTNEQQAGFNAVCRDLSTEPPTNLAVTNAPVVAGQPGVVVPVSPTSAVSCTFYNRAPNPAAEIVVDKLWAVNGAAPVPHGSQDPSLSGIATIDGSQVGFGNAQGGFSQGDIVPVGESLGTVPTLCVVDSQLITSVNGESADIDVAGGLTSDVTLEAGLNTVVITNTLTCPTKLTLFKDVQGGEAAPSDWTLSALTPVEGTPPFLAGPTGRDTDDNDGVTANVTPTAYYPLAEAGDLPATALYQQVDNRNPALSVPGSTGSWSCVTLNANGGTEGAGGNAGGLNGGVRVPFGTWVGCTAVNQTAQVELRKVVDDSNGGTASPEDWDLRTTPVDPPAGVGTSTVTSGDTVFLRPGLTYELSELNGPAGYEQVSLQCDTGPEGSYVDATSITLNATESAICVFTNIAELPKLSLDKVVSPSGVADKTSWTLSASRDDTDAVVATGAGGTSGQFVDVPSGVAFNLAETTALPNAGEFQAGTWQCFVNGGSAIPGPVLAPLSPGDTASCVVTNTLKPITPTITKTAAVPTPNANGSWTVDYDIVVTNPSNFQDLTYSLTDQLQFGSNVTINSASYQRTLPAPPGASTAFSAPLGGVQSFAGEPTLAKGTSHTWHVTVNATVAPGADFGGTSPTACDAGTPGTVGFLNTAVMTVGQTDYPAQDCTVPVKPTITKTGGTAVDNGDGTWTLPYTITVSNPSLTTGVRYDLVDALDLPASVDLVGAAVVSAPVATVATWTGVAPNTLLADDVALAGGAGPHQYVIEATVELDADDPSYACPSADGLNNTATVVAGNQSADATGCVVVNAPQITHTKAVVPGSVVQAVDGTWSIAYDIIVTNSGPIGGVYDLVDTTHFGAGVTGGTYSATENGAPIAGWTNGDALANDAYLAAGDPDPTDTYRVTVTGITVEGPDLTPAQSACPTGGDTDAAFNNTATLTVAGVDVDQSACESPSAPSIVKSGATSSQQPDASWNVTYTLTVSNTDPGAKPSFYTLTDDPQFPAGVDYVSYSVDGGAPVTPYDGSEFTVAENQPIGAGETDVYTIVLNVDAPVGDIDPVELECATENTPDGVGFLNEGILTSGEIVRTDEDCTNISRGGQPTVEKGDPTLTQDGDGLWTIVYDVTVTGNAEFVSRYTLADTLRFGPEVDIESAAWENADDPTENGTWSDPEADPTTQIVDSPRVIGIDAVHSYTVTVTALVDRDAFDDLATNTCAPTEEDPNVGFLNEVTITSDGIDSSDTGCDLPARPEVIKSPEGVVTKVGDHWEASYLITVTNLSADQALVYDLTDTPDFAGDVTITDREVTSADVTVNPDWNGADAATDVVVEDQELAGGATHTFEVVVSFTVANAENGPDLRCDGEGGKGLLNGAVVISGDEYPDDACHDVPVTVEVTKFWVFNGGSPIRWDSPLLPDGVEATLQLDGDASEWDTVYGPYEAGDTVTISETGVALRDGTRCTLNTEATTGLGDVELEGTVNEFTVTNHVDCLQSVTLTKLVDNQHGGLAVPMDWSVSGTNAGNDTDTFGGAGTVTAEAQVGVGYSLNEVSTIWGPDQYEVSVPWSCTSSTGDAVQLINSTIPNRATLTLTEFGVNVTCEITNRDIAPTLTLEKIVEPEEVAADFPPTLWTLTASDDGTPVLEGDGGATGGVDANVAYDLAESADFPEAGEFTAGDWICLDIGQDPAVPVVVDDDAVTLESGQDVTCQITNTAEPATYEVDKQVASAEQQPDGTWLITYEITVENTSGVSPLEYDLVDDLSQFGEGITIDSAEWTGDNGTDGEWEDLPDTLEETFVTDQPLAAGATDTYEVTVVATVTAGAWSDDTTECSIDEQFEPGGFRNVATVTIDDLPTVRTDCDEPGTSTAEKLVTDGPVSNGDGTFEVTYEITVTNDSDKDQYYDLSDAPAFPAGTTFTATALDPDGNEVADWTGEAPDTVLAEDRLLPAATEGGPTVEVWTITATVDIDEMTSIDEAKCLETTEGHGLFNGAEYTSGTITTPISDCVDIPVAKLTLIKNVDNSSVEGLPITGGQPSDWTLTADGPESDLSVVGSEEGVATIVPIGEYALSEEAVADPSSPLVPDYYEASDWVCGDGPDGTPVTLEAGDDVTCEITNVLFPVDVGIEKAADLPDGVTAVDDTEDNEFEWVLTVTNHGRPVANLEVTDLIDPQLEITGPATFEPAEGWTEDTEGNAFSATYTGIYAADQVTTIRIPVRLPAPPPIDPGDAVGPDDPVPPVPELDTDPIPNEACVAILGLEPGLAAAAVEPELRNLDDVNAENDCAEAEVPVKRIQPTAYVRCIADVPWLYFDVQATENVTPGDITVTWTSADGTLTKVQTVPWDERNGRLLWPGAEVDENGVPFAFPGWRPITEADLADPDSVVPGFRFLDLILDEDSPTFPWRGETYTPTGDPENPYTVTKEPGSVTFSVNPSQTVLAFYPQALPTCAIDRPAELDIEKTASVTSTKAGGDYTYSLQVTSVGTGATNPTEVFDEIPANLRVDEITTAPAPAFPRWEDCEVTGEDSAGYGGTLHCALLGQLGPNFTTAPVIDLAVHVREGTTVSSIDNTGEVCWQTADDPDPVTECADDTVTVTLLGGTAVTGFATGPWVWGAAGLVILGGLAVTWVMLRRRREAVDD